MQQFPRITLDPEVMGGKPCIRGMRVTVGMIVEALSAGRTIDQLLVDFPYLEEQDIREALAFAARLARTMHSIGPPLVLHRPRIVRSANLRVSADTPF